MESYRDEIEDSQEDSAGAENGNVNGVGSRPRGDFSEVLVGDGDHEQWRDVHERGEEH